MEKSMYRLDKGQIEVVDDAMVEVLRKKSHAERIRVGFTLWESARDMLAFHLQKTHPEWDEKRVQQEVSGRFLHGTL
jgi:hypothetical protein